MDASSGQLQEMANNSLESMLVSSKAQEDQRKPLRPQPEQALKCPRCDSTNTKFCYYNNYSLSQPRYFCKSCRRYWTNGGTLRNVPVGGGCRKNKRSSSSSSSSKRSQDQPLIGSDTIPLLTHFPHLSYDTNDDHLSLAFARLQKQNGGQLGFDGHQHDFSILGNPTSTHCDLLRNPSISMNNATTPSFTHNNFQNLYYGFGNGSNMGEADHHHHHHHHHHHDHHDHDHGVSAEMLMPFGDHHHQMRTTVKQESFNSRESESNMVLWGFPRQLNNIADGGVNELNNSWHGLLNSPLI